MVTAESESIHKYQANWNTSDTITCAERHSIPNTKLIKKTIILEKEIKEDGP